MTFHLEHFYTPVKIDFPHDMGGKWVRRRVPNANWTCPLWRTWMCCPSTPFFHQEATLYLQVFSQELLFLCKTFYKHPIPWLAFPPFSYSHIQAQLFCWLVLLLIFEGQTSFSWDSPPSLETSHTMRRTQRQLWPLCQTLLPALPLFFQQRALWVSC